MYNKNVRYGSDYYLTQSNPMTAVIGANCNDRIIIATDSKVSSNDNMKMLGFPKIFKGKPTGNLTYYLAGAGQSTYIEEYKELLNKNSKSISTLEEFRKLCKDTMDDIVKEYFHEKIEKFKIPFDPIDRYINTENFPLSIMIGVLMGGELDLFYVSSCGNIGKVKSFLPFGTTLSKSLTRFIFKKIEDIDIYSIDILDFNLTINSILYILEEIKIYDDLCGGETQLKILDINREWDNESIKNIINYFNKNIYPNMSTGYKLKEKIEENGIDYTKDNFISDLKKVCQPIKKTDKRKPSSEKT